MKIATPFDNKAQIKPFFCQSFGEDSKKKKQQSLQKKFQNRPDETSEAASNYNKGLLLLRKKTMRQKRLNDYDGLIFRIISEKNPEDFFKKYFSMFPDDFKGFRADKSWLGPPANGKIYPWKIHLYSDNEQDFMKIFAIIFPYLKKSNYNWKSYNPFNLDYMLRRQNAGVQKGKAFTFYPHSGEEFKKIAQDLEYILKNNGLEISGSKIEGDRALGSTGRLFYRYEFKTGAMKNKILDLNKKSDCALYQEAYDKNRGAGNYLAPDMSIKDDPWYRFKP